MDQFQADEPWTVVPGPAPTDGHYVPLIGYDAQHLYCVSWGRVQPMTWDFFETYCDEAWALLSHEFLVNGKSVDGYDFQQLRADLGTLDG